MISHDIPLYPIISHYIIISHISMFHVDHVVVQVTISHRKKSRLLTAASRSFRPISSTSCSLVSTSNADVWSVVRL